MVEDETCYCCRRSLEVKVVVKQNQQNNRRDFTTCHFQTRRLMKEIVFCWESFEAFTDMSENATIHESEKELQFSELVNLAVLFWVIQEV